jgi:hypothetical protein
VVRTEGKKKKRTGARAASKKKMGGGRLRGATWREGEWVGGWRPARRVTGGGGRPGVATCARAGDEGDPVGVGLGWAVAVGRPKGIATFCFIQTHFQPN